MIVVLILALMKEFVPIMLLLILVHAKLVSEEIAAKKVRNNLVSENQCNVLYNQSNDTL